MTVQETIWNYFLNKEFTPQSIAGIMGNIEKESLFIPNNVQDGYGYTDSQYTTMVDNGTYDNFIDDGIGYGLVQWTYGPFKKDLYNRCKLQNKSISNLSCQLDQLYSHLQSEGILNQLKNLVSIEIATTLFMTKFEKPKDQSKEAQEERIGYAKKWFNILNNNQGGNNRMKYSQSNPPLACIMTNSTCFKSTSKMAVKGILIHSTGANNKTLKRYVQPSDDDPNYDILIQKLGKNTNYNDWNHIEVQAGLNAWIGTLADGSITTVQTMPWDCKPWGCGSGSRGSCNDGWIQFEICEDSLVDGNYFMKVYQEACELIAYLCKLYRINPMGSIQFNGVSVPNILCHQDSYQLGLGTNHSDIYHWFTKYGKTMSDIRNDVAKLLGTTTETAQLNNTIKTPTLYKNMGINDQVKKMQELLIKLGYDLGIDGADGDFGPVTEEAVKTFQQKHGLNPDGIFTVDTYKLLIKDIQSLESTELYRVRKAWNIPQSQIGAYKNLNTAKLIVDRLGSAYHVYDANGNEVYPNVSMANDNQQSNTSIGISLPIAVTYDDVKLASSSKDENGRYTGGQKGDQTGSEVHILNWYNNSWNYVLRPKTQDLAERIARAAEAGCSNDNIGYNQSARNTLYIEALKVGLDLSKITTPCDCDCSSFASTCCICAGLSPSLFYAGGNMCTTHTIRQACEASGQFLTLSGNQYTAQKDYLKRGDLLLNTNSHVVIVVGSGSQAEPTITIDTPTQYLYRVQVKVNTLNIRETPNATAKIVGQISKGQVYTIVAEEGGFGKLKSGAGWISLQYVNKLL